MLLATMTKMAISSSMVKFMMGEMTMKSLKKTHLTLRQLTTVVLAIWLALLQMVKAMLLATLMKMEIFSSARSALSMIALVLPLDG